MMYIWIVLFVLALCCALIALLYNISLRRRLDYLRGIIFSLTTGTLFTESLETISAAYGLTPEELMFLIENYQNASGGKK